MMKQICKDEPRFMWPLVRRSKYIQEKYFASKWFAEKQELFDELERIKRLAKEAILHVWPSGGYGADPVGFVMAAYQVQAGTIKTQKEELARWEELWKSCKEMNEGVLGSENKQLAIAASYALKVNRIKELETELEKIMSEQAGVKKVLLNAIPREIANDELSYEEIVQMTYPQAHPQQIFTVVYRGEGGEGSLIPGAKLTVHNEMIITVADTSRA